MIVLRILVADSGSDTGSQWQATQEEELSSKKKWCIQSESPNAMQFQCCSKTSLPLNGNFKHWKYIWTHRTCKVAYRDCSPQQMSWSPVQSLTKKSLLFWLSNLTGNVESSSWPTWRNRGAFKNVVRIRFFKPTMVDLRMWLQCHKVLIDLCAWDRQSSRSLAVCQWALAGFNIHNQGATVACCCKYS